MKPDAVPSPTELAAIPPEEAEERLVRLATWSVDGQLAAAELDLYEWQRQDDCPVAARVLLASLLARRGKLDDARAVLHTHEHTHTDQDPQLLQMLVSNLIAADLNDAAARLAGQLHHHHGNDPSIAAWIQVMQSPAAGELPLLPDAQVEQLASELAAQPDTIPSLVAAQRVQPAPHEIALLRQAINRMARDFQDDPHQTLILCQAMAELALFADDNDDARRWAHRGLRINSHSAPLALVLARVGDDPSFERRAVDVLHEAVAAHPTYPDLRAAMIRREYNDGRAEAARLHLKDWLQTHPDHPIAKRVEEELAA